MSVCPPANLTNVVLTPLICFFSHFTKRRFPKQGESYKRHWMSVTCIGTITVLFKESFRTQCMIGNDGPRFWNFAGHRNRSRAGKRKPASKIKNIIVLRLSPINGMPGCFFTVLIHWRFGRSALWLHCGIIWIFYIFACDKLRAPNSLSNQFSSEQNRAKRATSNGIVAFLWDGKVAYDTDQHPEVWLGLKNSQKIMNFARWIYVVAIAPTYQFHACIRYRLDFRRFRVAHVSEHISVVGRHFFYM